MLKAIKKAIAGGVLSILITLVTLLGYADTLIIPAIGVLPNDFRNKMHDAGYKIEYSPDKVTKKTFAYCEFKGQTYVLQTIKPVSK